MEHHAISEADFDAARQRLIDRHNENPEAVRRHASWCRDLDGLSESDSVPAYEPSKGLVIAEVGRHATALRRAEAERVFDEESGEIEPLFKRYSELGDVSEKQEVAEQLVPLLRKRLAALRQAHPDIQISSPSSTCNNPEVVELYVDLHHFRMALTNPAWS